MSKISIYNSSTGGAGILTISGDIGGAISPDGAGNLTFTGGADLTVTGTPGTNSFEVTIDEIFSSINVHPWFGATIESASISVASDGTTITFSVEQAGGGDLTVIFGDGYYNWDCTPADTVTLTAGTDTVPVMNYVYLDNITKTLTAGTNWPHTGAAPLATVLCQSAASIQTDGPMKVHAWTDHLSSTSTTGGHISHLNLWIRQQYATWLSDVSPTLTITTNGAAPDNVIFTNTSGAVLQLHPHIFPAFTGTQDIYTVNDSVAAYNKITDLNELLTDSTGATMSGRYFSLVIWGVVSQSTGDCKLMVNLPSCSYGTEAQLQTDVSKCVNYSMPANFKGTGFLIAKLNLRHQTASSGTWTEISVEDLRGQFPSTSAGGASTVVAEFADSTFRVFDDLDTTKEMAFQISGVTTATTRTITMCDADLDLTSPSFGGTVTAATGITSSSFTQGVVLSDGTGVLSSSAGTTNYVLTSNGAGLVPTWKAAGGGGVDSVTGGTNINTTGTAADPIINLDDSISLSQATGSTVGVINLGSVRMFSRGTSSVYIGQNVSNYTSTGARNVGIGNECLVSLTSGYDNIAIGQVAGWDIDTGHHNKLFGVGAGAAITSGTYNIAIGYSSSNSITDASYNVAIGYKALRIGNGSYNTAIGYEAGEGLGTTDSDNIFIRSVGTSGDNNTIRIGTQGTGNGQQDTTFIAGIYNTTPTSGNGGTVIIDSNGQLGSTTAVTGSLALNNQTGTTYTTILGDQNTYVTMTNASASTLTIPSNSSVAYPIGSVIYVQQLGAGQVTLTPGAAVTFRSADDAYKLVKQYSGAALIKIASDTWGVMGDVEA